MPENAMPKLPDVISTLLMAGEYAAEFPLMFQTWAIGKGYLVMHGDCEHTESEHADMLIADVKDGMDAVAYAFGIGHAIIEGLGGIGNGMG